MMREFLICGAIAAALPAPAGAANVNLSATLVSSCTLSIGTNGTMTASTGGVELSSENAGGAAATMTLVAIGTLPTVTFAAPTLSQSPAGWSETPTLSIRYTSLNGANRSYTSSSSSYNETSLLDTFTVHGKVASSNGFAAGTYTLTTVATCS